MPVFSTHDARIQKQLENFGLTEPSRLTSVKSAEKFLKKVGIALRYWRTEKIPLASLYQAAVGSPGAPPKEKTVAGISQREEAQRIAIELTNHLLASHQGIEVNTIADRICLVHRDLVPSLYVLVRHHRPPDDLKDISVQAKKIFRFIEQSKETTAGQVRKFLGMPAIDLNNDPAYNALAELQSKLLVDRGPFLVRKSGIPYLSKEGYPYHCFHLAHEALVRESTRLTREEAAQNFLYGYLRGAVFAMDKKLLSMFKTFFTAEEMTDTLDQLKLNKVSIENVKREKLIVIKK